MYIVIDMNDNYEVNEAFTDLKEAILEVKELAKLDSSCSIYEADVKDVNINSISGADYVKNTAQKINKKDLK